MNIGYHYYTIKTLAVKAGFSNEEAQTIASYSQAVDDYVLWQCTRMGRDINPDMLRHKVISAGAKRIEISSPEFTVVAPGSVPSLTEMTVIYGGLEND